MAFDDPFRLVALITPRLLRIRKSIEADIGGSANAHLGHPVNFEGRDTFSNQLAMSRLDEAFGYAGVTQRSFYPEPIAASVSFLHANPDAQGETVLSLDFGGGTLDFCLLRRQGQDFNVIATHGIGLGGDHLDQILFRQLLFPHLGKGEVWKRRGFDREIETRFPFEEFEDLLVNWAPVILSSPNIICSAIFWHTSICFLCCLLLLPWLISTIIDSSRLFLFRISEVSSMNSF